MLFRSMGAGLPAFSEVGGVSGSGVFEAGLYAPLLGTGHGREKIRCCLAIRALAVSASIMPYPIIPLTLKAQVFEVSLGLVNPTKEDLLSLIQHCHPIE